MIFTLKNTAGAGCATRVSMMKMHFQNQFVPGHLFVKMYQLTVEDRSKSLLIPGAVFAYSSMVDSC